jgi:hypothetical protein
VRRSIKKQFMLEEARNQQKAGGRLLATCGPLVSCLAYSSTPKMEGQCSETSVAFQWTTQRYIPEDRTLHNHRCENLKSYSLFLFTVLLRTGSRIPLLGNHNSRVQFTANRISAAFPDVVSWPWVARSFKLCVLSTTSRTHRVWRLSPTYS